MVYQETGLSRIQENLFGTFHGHQQY